MFPGNECPFQTDCAGDVIGYYYDDNNEVPKYKLEFNSERVRRQMLPQWKRIDEYNHNEIKWNTIQDRDDNFMQWSTYRRHRLL